VKLEATEQLAYALKAENVDSACAKFRYPLKFASIEEEVSFLALIRLLEFGSGFDAEIRSKKKDKSAKDVIQVRSHSSSLSNTHKECCLVLRTELDQQACMQPAHRSIQSHARRQSTTTFCVCSSG
jgi:hypothetical protein